MCCLQAKCCTIASCVLGDHEVVTRDFEVESLLCLSCKSACFLGSVFKADDVAKNEVICAHALPADASKLQAGDGNIQMLDLPQMNAYSVW